MLFSASSAKSRRIGTVSSVSIALLIFVCVYGAALLGVMLNTVLPPSHRSAETREVVKLSVGLVATMSALLLGLLVSSAKGSYDAQQARVIQIAAKVAFLDRTLSVAGPDAGEVRQHLKENIESLIVRVWPDDHGAGPNLRPDRSRGDVLYGAINKLTPETDEQKGAKALALQTTVELGQLNNLIYAQAGSRIPMTLLVVVVSWLAIAFVSFGLFAPPNATALSALTIASVAVSAALFLILELDRAFGGLIGITSTPIQIALQQIGT